MYFSRDEHTQDIYSDLKLYSCKGDEPPERVDDLNVRREGTITTRFKSKDEAVESKYNLNKDKMLYNFKYTVEVDFRSSEGILGFKSFKGEKEAGTVGFPIEFCSRLTDYRLPSRSTTSDPDEAIRSTCVFNCFVLLGFAVGSEREYLKVLTY